MRADLSKTERIENKKAAIELETLGWIILGLVIFVVIIVGYIYLTGHGISALDFLKNLFRTRR